MLRALVGDALAALGAQVGALAIVAGMVLALTSSTNMGPGQWFDVATWLTGMGLGGSLSASASGNVVGFSGAAQTTLSVHPLTLTFTALAAVWALTARRERRSPTATVAQLLGSAAVTGVTYALALLILSAATASDGMAPQVHLALSSGSATFGALVLVTAAAFLARSREYLRRTTGAGLSAFAVRRFGAWHAPLVTGLTFTGALIILGQLVATVWILTQNNVSTGLGLTLAITLGPNLGVITGGLGSGTTVASATSTQFDGGALTNLFGSALPNPDASHSAGLLAGSVPAAAYLLLLMPLVAAALAAFRLAAATPAHELTWDRLWRYTLVSGALWLVLAFAAGAQLDLSMQVDGNQDFGIGAIDQGGGTLTAGLSVLGAAVAAAVWTAAAYAAARKADAWLAGLPDGVTRLALRLPGLPPRTAPAPAAAGGPDVPNAEAAW